LDIEPDERVKKAMNEINVGMLCFLDVHHVLASIELYSYLSFSTMLTSVVVLV